MIKTAIKPSIKAITRPLPDVLGSIIKALEQEGVQYNGLSELAKIITNRFNVTVTEDDLINYYKPRICEIESELLYKLYGY